MNQMDVCGNVMVCHGSCHGNRTVAVLKILHFVSFFDVRYL